MRTARQSLSSLVLVSALAFLLACGPGQEPTPTPTTAPTATAVPTATPTTAPVATATPTRPGPAATPTPTSVAAPSPTPTPGVQPKRGGILRHVHGAYPPSYDQQFLSVQIAYSTWVTRLYNNLMANYEGDKIDCEICTEWHLEDSGKTMVFNLLPGIKFHNGKEMTSTDVAYSLKMLMGEIDGLVSPRSGVIKEYIQAIETPSKSQIKIKLLRSSAFVPQVLSITTSAIYPEGTTRDNLAKGPAGSGPFLLAKAIPGASMTFERNPNYFKAGLPYLDGAEVTLLADATARYAALLTHKTELVVADNSIPEQIRDQMNKLVAAKKVNYSVALGGCGIQGAFMVVSKPPFDSLKLRQAVNLALDRHDVGSVYWGKDRYIEQVLFFNQGFYWATPKEQIWNIIPGWGQGAKKQQEIEQAKQLVKDAGHPAGIDVLMLGRTTQWGWQVLSEEVQRELTKVGIRATFELYDVATHSQKLVDAKYQIHPYNYCMTTFDPDEAVGQYWLTGGARNNFGYSNPEVDRLFVAMSSELDPAKRRALFFQIQDIIVLKDVAYATLPHVNGDNYWWSRVQGFTMGFSANFSNGLRREDRLWFQD